MKITHNFVLKDGTVVDSLPPEEEEKLKQKMRETFWPAFYELRPRSDKRDQDEKATQMKGDEGSNKRKVNRSNDRKPGNGKG